MTPATLLGRAAADGVQLSLSPAGALKAMGPATAVNRWLPAIRAHKPELLDRLTRLRASFDVVMAAFRTPAEEIDLAWSLALATLDAAEAVFHSNAAMIRAGWRPLDEQAAAFGQRETGSPLRRGFKPQENPNALLGLGSKR